MVCDASRPNYARDDGATAMAYSRWEVSLVHIPEVVALMRATVDKQSRQRDSPCNEWSSVRKEGN
jgi:hypothetical protein